MKKQLNEPFERNTEYVTKLSITDEDGVDIYCLRDKGEGTVSIGCRGGGHVNMSTQCFVLLAIKMLAIMQEVKDV